MSIDARGLTHKHLEQTGEIAERVRRGACSRLGLGRGAVRQRVVSPGARHGRVRSVRKTNDPAGPGSIPPDPDHFQRATNERMRSMRDADPRGRIKSGYVV